MIGFRTNNNSGIKFKQTKVLKLLRIWLYLNRNIHDIGIWRNELLMNFNMISIPFLSLCHQAAYLLGENEIKGFTVSNK